MLQGEKMNFLNRALLFISIIGFFGIGCNQGCLCDTQEDKKVAAPSFAIALGTYYNVTIQSATVAAEIFYTIDGSDPKTSATAVKGTNLSIDIFTTIKAYARKTDFEDSAVTSYSIQYAKRIERLNYNPDLTLQSYLYKDFDCNGSKMIETWYTGAGADGFWRTDDDVVGYYFLYEYNSSGKIIKETKYTAKGADGVWFSSDDVSGLYYEYSYSGGLVQQKDQYDDSETLVDYIVYSYTAAGLVDIEEGFDNLDVRQYYIQYAYTAENVLDTKSKYTDSGVDTTWFTADDVLADEDSFQYTGNTEFYELYVYDPVATTLLTKKEKYFNYGTDTLLTYTDLEYDGSDVLLKEITYVDPAATTVALQSIYVYDADSGVKLEKRNYSDADAAVLVDYTSFLYEGSVNTRQEVYDSNNIMQTFDTFEYDGDDKLVKKVTFISPGPRVKTIKWNINIEANLETSGFYMVGDATYDLDGIQLSVSPTDPADDSDFIQTATAVVKTVIENTQFTQSGLLIRGTNGGSCTISISNIEANSSIALSELSLNGIEIDDFSASGLIEIKFRFNDFDNGGDIVLNGAIRKMFDGTINYTDGSLSGSMNGNIKGEIAVTSVNPKWESSDFTMSYYTAYEYTGDDLVKETVYIDAGENGIWYDGDDTIDYYYDYTINTGVIEQRDFKRDFGIFRTNTVNGYSFEFVAEDATVETTDEKK